MHLFNIPVWIGLTYTAIATLLAFVGRDWRARAIAACQAASVIDVDVFCDAWACHTRTLQWLNVSRMAIEDLVTLAVCVVCLVRAKRYWVLWATSFVVLITITDALLAFDAHVSQWAGASAIVVWNYALNTAILIGAWPSARARFHALMGGTA